MNYLLNEELFDSTENQSREAKHVWKKINATVEETGELTNKVI